MTKTPLEKKVPFIIILDDFFYRFSFGVPTRIEIILWIIFFLTIRWSLK